MRRQRKLSWQASEKRWRGSWRPKGAPRSAIRQFSFPASSRLGSEREAYVRFNAWVLEQERSSDPQGHAAAQQTADWLAGYAAAIEAGPDTHAARADWRWVRAQIESVMTALRTGIVPQPSPEILALDPAIARAHDQALNTFEGASGQPVSAGGFSVVRELIPTTDTPQDAPPWVEPEANVERLLSTNIELYLATKREQVERGRLSSGRYGVLASTLRRFADYMGREVLVDSITSRALEGFRLALVQDEKIADSSRATYLTVASTFVRWLYSREVIESMPRVLSSRDFAISVPDRAIQTLSVDDVSRILTDKRMTDELRLYVLLSLNCGFTQQDLSDLRHDDVDWSAGTITRKRSKTKGEAGAPVVTYPLWPATFELLRRLRSDHPELVLTTQDGQPLVRQHICKSGSSRTDAIVAKYRRLATRLGVLPFKHLRKTSASLLDGHERYSRYAQYFLGHAPGTIAGKHYVKPSEAEFAAAISWLGQALGV